MSKFNPTQKWKIDRRHFLKCAGGGAAAAIALPLLEIMGWQEAKAALAVSPKRFGMIYFQAGMNPATWWPAGEGTGMNVANSSLKSFAGFQDYVRVLRGINADKTNVFGHGRALSGFLTALAPADRNLIKNTVSMDQVIAKSAVAQGTKIPSLHVTGVNFKYADDPWTFGLNAACSFNADGTLNDNDDNAARIFDRLFAGTSSNDTNSDVNRRAVLKKSLLDTVIGDRQALNSKLSAADRARMDEFYTNLRTIEQRIDTVGVGSPGVAACTLPSRKPLNLRDRNIARTAGYNNTIDLVDLSIYWDILFDILFLAYQCDATRVFTFPLSTEAASELYENIGINQGYHFNTTHHGGNATKLAQYTRVNEYQASHSARFLQKLKDTKEGAGNMLDNTVIYFGGGLEDSNEHKNTNIPIALVGKGGGAIQTGFLQRVNGVHIGNVHATVLSDAFGIATNRFGGGNGKLALK